jgi:hypothetical protein
MLQMEIESSDPFKEPPFLTRTADAARHRGVNTPLSARKILDQWRKYAATRNRSYNSGKTVLSLFDESGMWSAPYVLAGYDVIQLDIQNSVDIEDLNLEAMHEAAIDSVDIILAACPCTHFAVSGARWFKGKDASGVTDDAVELVHHTMRIIDYYQPEVWCIENPVGRIKNLCSLPSPRLTFQPHHSGDPYTKKTQLFGNFNPNLPINNVEPTEGSRVHKLRGDVPEQKKLRSMTPEGFAFAFFIANQ